VIRIDVPTVALTANEERARRIQRVGPRPRRRPGRRALSAIDERLPE